MQQQQFLAVDRRRIFGGGLFVALAVLMSVLIVRLRETSQATAQPPVAAIAFEPSRESVAIATPSSPDPTQSTRPDDAPPSSNLLDRVSGIWQLKRHGQRTLTVRSDGTATAEVQLNMIGTLMYGKMLKLELVWTLDDDVMTQTITSGSPEEAVSRLVRDWGDQRQYRIIEVTDDQLVLTEVGDNADRQVWTAVRTGDNTSPGDNGQPSLTSETQQSPR